MPRTSKQPSEQLAKHRIRSKIEAKLLDGSADSTHARYGAAKEAAIAAMSGVVVELGPGTGLNMRYYSPGTRVIGFEPNPLMHDWLRPAAAEFGIDYEIRGSGAETLDIENDSVDGVVGTRVLCGVQDITSVLNEVYRVLKPGGSYFFIEHVVAPDQGAVRQTQRVLKHPHRWMFNGCEVDRDITAHIRAANFSTVTLDEVDQGRSAAYLRHHIVGTAIK